MTEEMMELGRRAVACKGWRWMKGMRDTTGRLFIQHADCNDAAWLWVADDGCEHIPVEGRVPALSDHATLGCLEGLVVDGYAGKVVLTRGNGWFSVETDSHTWDDDNTPSYKSALVAALEAAP